MEREFPLADLDLRKALVLPLALAVTGCAGIFWLATRDARMPPSLVAVVVLAMAIGMAMPVLALRRRRVALVDDVLTVVAGFRTRRIPVDTLDPDRARIVDLHDDPSMRPRLKLSGAALPGYRAGWFLLGDRRPAFVLVTATAPALWLPRVSGRPLLLTLQRPQTLLDALRDVATRQRGR